MKISLFITATLFLFITNFIEIKSDCSIQRECTPETENTTACQPQPAEGELKKTRILPKGAPEVVQFCPEFDGKEACCSLLQVRKLLGSFTSIEGIFGTSAGGCDLCVVNMKRFWCHFTCDPNQASFLKVDGYSNHTFGNDTKKLLDLELTINDNTNCELFNSCKKTKFASQVPAMSNAVGFTNFQGINAHTKNAVYIKVKTSTEGGLQYDPDPCDTLPDKEGKVRGIPISSPCSCNSCPLKCNYNLASTTPVLEGMSYILVGAFYGASIVLTIGIYFIKHLNNNKSNN